MPFAAIIAGVAAATYFAYRYLAPVKTEEEILAEKLEFTGDGIIVKEE